MTIMTYKQMIHIHLVLIAWWTKKQGLVCRVSTDPPQQKEITTENFRRIYATPVSITLTLF